MRVWRIEAEVPTTSGGVLTPNFCQVCKQPGPGIIAVRGLDGVLFSVHRWPCAALLQRGGEV